MCEDWPIDNVPVRWFPRILLDTEINKRNHEAQLGELTRLVVG